MSVRIQKEVVHTVKRIIQGILAIAVALPLVAFSPHHDARAAGEWSSSLGDTTTIEKPASTYELVQWPDTWRSKKGAAGRPRTSFQCTQLGVDPCTTDRIAAASKVYALNPDKSITQDFMNREWAIIGYAEFGACKSDSDFGCIESISVTTPGKGMSKATFREYLRPDWSRAGQSEFNAINSESDSIWVTPDKKEFQVSNVARLEFSRGLVTYNDFKFVLTRADSDGALPTPYSATVSLRVPKGIGGWFYGRLENIDISYQAATDSYSRLIISGGSVAVPAVNFAIPFSKISAADKKTIGSWVPSDGYGPTNTDVSKRAKLANLVSKYGQSASSYEDQTWMFGQNAGWWGPSKCFFDVDPVTGEWIEFKKPKVIGFVTTNAMIFDSFPATFSNGSMDFQVAGMHYDSKKRLTSGHYEMVMDAEAARCFYHYTQAPISASISVVNEEGENKVATKSVRITGNTLRLVADNFTFSAPKVRVKIKGKLAPKSSLVCGKGSLTKKVVDWDPVCPPGFAPKK